MRLESVLLHSYFFMCAVGIHCGCVPTALLHASAVMNIN